MAPTRREAEHRRMGEVGVAVRLFDRAFADLGLVHAPLPVEVGDIVSREHGPPLRVVDLVEFGLVGDTVRYIVEVEEIRPRLLP
jgi:hypothetical protein